jgi:predicted nucleic acid-binding protein
MRFWDSSAMVPLILVQPDTDRVVPLAREDAGVVAWWGSPVECASASARLHREGLLSQKDLARAAEVQARLFEGAEQVLATDDVRARAVRLLGVHALRAADSLQLAAALAWCRERPEGHDFVCLDDRLRSAAVLEGFRVLPAG